jgi:short-subunit dehydrogenase involved in D-alanine esterification of teichoic acids
MGHVVDVGQKAEREAMLKKINDKHGRLDVLVPNVGCVNHMGS